MKNNNPTLMSEADLDAHIQLVDCFVCFVFTLMRSPAHNPHGLTLKEGISLVAMSREFWRALEYDALRYLEQYPEPR